MTQPLTDAQIETLRAATPGCQRVIHFNHSGASLPSQATITAMIEQMNREASQGPMEAAAQGETLLENARDTAARLINCTPSSIAFLSSGSAAWGMAFSALGAWRRGDRILVGRHEWGGNLACMAQAFATGASLEVIPCDENGAVSVPALEAMIDERVRLISLTWLPANGGLINPAAAIGAVAKRHNIPYFIDAGQALGQISVDVQALGCDVLKGACRKFLRGPRGTALLYIREGYVEQLQPPFVDVLSAPRHGENFTPRNDARRFETSEISLTLIAGLNNALSEVEALGVGRVRQRIQQLASSLRQRMTEVTGLKLQDCGAATDQSGLVSFTLEGWDAVEIKQQLAAKGINIGANGVAYTPLDMQARGLVNIARISVSYLNTDVEIDTLLLALREMSPMRKKAL
ncbi:aminotransferase class V-fold PLP-dependent enzyme [Pseudomonas viridiflava]|uniref:aminotransferase class V-fold PLP-dependent enzyme n=1 Tax=Pseudomonas viridiflava TaxID=33069 RepID=UPI000F0568C0|nr:aminotransferase class V-fold PLP-dependent enzyme [Pseudomonas viridiflava]